LTAFIDTATLARSSTYPEYFRIQQSIVRTVVPDGTQSRLDEPMKTTCKRDWRAAWLLLTPGLLLPLFAQQSSSLAITGRTGTARVTQVRGRNYVDVEDLARLTNASIHFNGNQIVVSFSDAEPAPAAQPGFSKDFVNAGIEAMAQQREWRAALKYAIEGGYPLTESWLSSFRARAQQALSVASVAAATDADRSALPLLTSQFNRMGSLSDKYLGMAVSLSYIDPKSLDNDTLDQKMIACTHSLSSMATANQFVDDGTCH
jgi:hypothetical protein